MRVLRSSMFVDMTHPPITTVVRDSDVIDTLESVALQSHQQGTLIVHDIFDMPNESIQQATRQAMRRMDKKRELNMAVLFHWALQSFRLMRDGGSLMMDKRAPLNVEDIRYVFDQLKAEPGYRDFHVSSFANDGTRIEIVKGEIR